MSRLRKTAPLPQHDVHYVHIHNVESNQIEPLPVLEVMRNYLHVQEDGEMRPYKMADFYFESGAPLPHVHVGWMDKVKEKVNKGIKSIKKKSEQANEWANKKKKSLSDGISNKVNKVNKSLQNAQRKASEKMDIKGKVEKANAKLDSVKKKLEKKKPQPVEEDDGKMPEAVPHNLVY